MAKRFLTALNLSPSASDPATGSEGDAYFNSSSNKIRVYYDGAWNDLSGSGGGSSNSFETIRTPSGTWPVADSSTDELALNAGTGMIITGSSSTDTIEFATNATALNTASTIVYRDSDQAFDITAIDFDTADTISSAVGRLTWDDGEGTLNFGLKGGNINLEIGQENIALCFNGTGSTITKGSVVYISGAQGQRPSLALSDADTEETSSKTFGVVAENISDGLEGFVCTFGVVTGINTSSFTAGQALWLSSTAGQLTNVKPTQPAHAVFIGYCLSVNSSSGRIFVNPQNGYELNELHNVLINGIADNHIISYDNSTSLWKNQALVDAIKEVDGASSGIDADLLDGEQGSYYLDWTNATNKPDPVITLSGDLTGSVTLTDLTSQTLTAAVVDDSHNHTTSTIANFTEDVQDVVGGMVSSNTESGISVTYDDTNGKLDFNVNDPTVTLDGDITGSATMTNLGNISITTTNTDKGSSQSIFKNIAVSGQSTIVADTNDDTLTIESGTGITLTTNATTDTLTVTNAGVTGISGTSNQITVSSSTGSVTISLPSAVTFPGTVTLNADPTQDLQAATKQYVDSVAQGLHIHESCAAATTTNISDLSSPPASIDSVTLTTNMRVLVKNQSTNSQNGIYTFNGTALVRASDFDTAAEIDGGDFVFVTGGTVNNDTGWVQTEHLGTVGSDPIIFTQFSGAGTYTAGTGITLTGNQFSNAGVLSVNGSTGAITNVALTTGKLSQFAATTSSELAGVISDETGSGALVFANSPSFTGTADTERLSIDSTAYIDTITTTVSSTSATEIDSFVQSSFSSCEYLIQIKQASKVTVLKALMTSVDLDIVQYGIVESGGSIPYTITTDSFIPGGGPVTNKLLITITDANITSATVKVVRTSVV
jgi:hypothetical protein